MPVTLRVAVVLLLVEAVALAAVGVVDLYEVLFGDPARPDLALLAAVMVLAAAALLGVLARNLLRRKSWPRGPAFALQLLTLPVGYYMVTGGLAWVGVPLLIVVIATLAMLVAPATTKALGIR
jgi:hypothetical protein